MSKHTPGPWHIIGGKNWLRVAGRNDVKVTDVALPKYTDQTRAIHDARLIAAAPELLAALQNVRNAHRTGHNADEAWRWVDDAITKAIGETA
jgi:hypothetical protein